MKKLFLTLLAGLAPAAMFAQSAVDALQVTQPDFKGTARFMSMGGAFTALGGDMSTLTQNPAGVAVYRKSEISATLDLDFRSSKTEGYNMSNSESKTKFSCNNFGYIGTVNLNGAMQSISWGASYNRLSSFDRVAYGYAYPTSSSLSSYIASFSGGYEPGELDFGNDYNPYYNPDNDWLSVLAFTSYMIHPYKEDPTKPYKYNGLFQPGTEGDAEIKVRERGYVDEYNIDFGGNVNNVVYWGVGVGITDLSYTREVNYSESMADARVYDVNTKYGTDTGNAGFNLDNYKHIGGSGWNLKVGAIIRPINEVRIGFAVHTPTWYTLTENYQAGTQFSYLNKSLGEFVGYKDSEGYWHPGNPNTGSESTEYADFDWKLTTPWKMMGGVAFVLSDKAIVSADYEYQAFPSMRVQNQVGNYYSPDFRENKGVTEQVKKTCRGAHIIRVGGEYRVTPQFSLRAGYNFMQSGVKNEASDCQFEVMTAGTDPSFSLNKTVQRITCGLGYKYQAWSFDAALVYRMADSRLYCYTNVPEYNIEAPSFKLSDSDVSVAVTVSYRF